MTAGYTISKNQTRDWPKTSVQPVPETHGEPITTPFWTTAGLPSLPAFAGNPGCLRVRRLTNLRSHCYSSPIIIIMAVTLVLSGIFVSLSCFLEATFAEEIAGGLL